MTTDLVDTRDVAEDELVIPTEICEAFLEAITVDPGAGHIAKLRELGVEGRRGQIREAIERQLRADITVIRRERVRAEMLRRGVVGWDEDVYWQGDVVGQKRVFSDRCLVAVAQMLLPEARNQLEITGAEGGPLRVEVEGDRVSTISGVFGLAAQLGVAGVAGGLVAAAARGALPAAADVLPDPPDG